VNSKIYKVLIVNILHHLSLQNLFLKKRMTSLEKAILLLKKIVTNPSSLKRLMDYEDIYQKQLRSKYHITQLPILDIRALLPHFSETINHYTFLEGTSLPIDIALLKALARQFTSCHYLELGSWRGESLINIAEIAEHCTSISFADEDFRHLGLSEDMIQMNRILSKNLPNVTHIGHNTRTFDFKNLNQKYDLIFVDADHSYEAVRDDTRSVFPLLKDENSMIVWHDYSYNTETVRNPVLSGILDGLPNEDARKCLYHVSNTMCAIFTQKAFTQQTLKSKQTLDKVFSIQITAQEI
jgi:predicted O-methyltransferase YrrM